MSKQITDNQCDKKYKYDAFISYRHVELDKYIAEKIHKYLEEFKLPKNIKNRMGLKKTRIERVFRDKDELTITNNLEDPIIQALRESEYLIVICSRYTKESVWCRKEIEKFMEFHGRGKILTVLIEGEPEESFPEELLYEEEIVKEKGVESLHRKAVEPLAADIRANSKRQMCTLLKTELLRVIAPIFGLEYNDLRQRHKERRIRRILTTTVSAATLGLAIGVAGVVSAVIISNQKDKITAQNEFIEQQNEKLLSNQSESLAEMSLEYLAQDRRIDAINMALSSLTDYEGMKMPYTASGRYALTKALRVYDLGYIYKAKNQFVADTNINTTLLSPSRKYLLGSDLFNSVYIWDVVTGKCIIKLDDLDDKSMFSFVGDTMLAYRNNNRVIRVVDILKGEHLFTIEDVESISYIKGDSAGKYVAFVGDDKINVYDATNGKNIYQVEARKGKSFGKDIIWCGDKMLYLENKNITEDSEEQNIGTIKIANVKTGNITETVGAYNSLDGAQIEKGYIFIISSRVEDYEELGIVLAMEESSGNIIWKNEYKEMPTRKIEVTEKEGKLLVVTTSYSRLICINGKTGTEYYNENVLEGIYDFAIGSDSYVQMMNYTGKVVSFDLYNKEIYSLEHNFECNINDFYNVGICEGGYYVLPMTSSYIIRYEKLGSDDKEKYDADDKMREKMKELWNPPENCTEEAKKIGVTNSELVENILYINENIVMVTYVDMSVDIYDVTNKKSISFTKNIKSVPTKYYGTDNEGNIYVAGAICGYVFDKEYNLIAEIEDMKHADVENSYLIVGDITSELWKIPMYSLEELIAKAKIVVE